MASRHWRWILCQRCGRRKKFAPQTTPRCCGMRLGPRPRPCQLCGKLLRIEDVPANRLQPLMHCNVVCSKLSRRQLKYRVCGKTTRMEFRSGEVALISTADLPEVCLWYWYVGSDGYVSRTDASRCRPRLHAFLLKPHKGQAVDHVNRDRLDNRRSNLRIATAQDNMRNRGPNKSNRSGRCGVYWDKRRKRWHAQIKPNGRSISLGNFIHLSSAIKARVEAEKCYGWRTVA